MTSATSSSSSAQDSNPLEGKKHPYIDEATMEKLKKDNNTDLFHLIECLDRFFNIDFGHHRENTHQQLLRDIHEKRFASKDPNSSEFEKNLQKAWRAYVKGTKKRLFTAAKPPGLTQTISDALKTSTDPDFLLSKISTAIKQLFADNIHQANVTTSQYDEVSAMGQYSFSTSLYKLALTLQKIQAISRISKNQEEFIIRQLLTEAPKLMRDITQDEITNDIYGSALLPEIPGSNPLQGI